MWDTSGQERFRSVTHSYYRGALGALVVYDICNRVTFESLKSWLTDARTLAGPKISIILCGNKSDLPDEDRQVSLLEGSRFAQENDCMFLETSAVNGANIEEAFYKCARTILNKIEIGAIDIASPRSGQQIRNRSKGGESANLVGEGDESKTSTYSMCCAN